MICTQGKVFYSNFLLCMLNWFSYSDNNGKTFLLELKLLHLSMHLSDEGRTLENILATSGVDQITCLSSNNSWQFSRGALKPKNISHTDIFLAGWWQNSPISGVRCSSCDKIKIIYFMHTSSGHHGVLMKIFKSDMMSNKIGH